MFKHLKYNISQSLIKTYIGSIEINIDIHWLLSFVSCKCLIYSIYSQLFLALLLLRNTLIYRTLNSNSS